MTPVPSKVFMTRVPRPAKKDGWAPNIDKATEFGEIIPIFAVDDYLLDGTSWAHLKAIRILEGFIPDQDFIFYPSYSDPAALMITCFALAQMFPSTPIRFLSWRGSGPTGCYRPMVIYPANLQPANVRK